ncbi:IMPACT family protein [Hufsiella ginkgonis]|uniref:IMPACT family protein n=1 Tax=Hufsiella ginkgonis TaxID=2695274 RepID=UPI0034E19F68
MLFSDTYKTIAAPSEAAFTDRGSRFIAFAYPVTAEEQAKPLLDALRKQHPRAVHFCRAMRLTPDRSVFRISDDGEPAGSAGRPILNTLLSADVTNIFVVVVRYFGGTLLGVPGLINAYKTVTVQALASADIVERTISDIYRIEFGYAVMNDVMKLIKQHDLPVIHQQFDNRCLLEIAIAKGNVNRMIDMVGDISGVKSTYLGTI